MVKKGYSLLISAGAVLAPCLLLLIRLFWGVQFLQTGWGKWQDIGPVSDYFQMLGIPSPAFNAYLTATIELVCGSFLAIGLAARLAALPLIITMIIAFLTAHYPSVVNLFNDPQDFVCQLPFNFLLASLIVFCFGPGIFSIDALVEFVYKKNKN